MLPSVIYQNQAGIGARCELRLRQAVVIWKVMHNQDLGPEAVKDLAGRALPNASAKGAAFGEFMVVDLAIPYATITGLDLGSFRALRERLSQFGGTLSQLADGSYAARLPRVPITIFFPAEDQAQHKQIAAEVDAKLSKWQPKNADEVLSHKLPPGTDVAEYVWQALEARYESRGFVLMGDLDSGQLVMSLQKRSSGKG